MSQDVTSFTSLREISTHLRANLAKKKAKKLLLLFAHNGIGKTRLSVDFKDVAKQAGAPDTLYFNAFTEDLFYWDNDTINDTRRVLKMNKESLFFAGIEEQDMENKIRPLLKQYADFNFLIDYPKWEVNFIREIPINGKPENIEFIKVSRGEENIFIWCFFLAIAELAIDRQVGYEWVRNIYVDDPISSLDENNAIAVACQLAQLIKREDNTINFVVSTHHSLFFNVMYNEFGNGKAESYYLHRVGSDDYTLRSTKDAPFFHHVAMLAELKEAVDSNTVAPHHFNIMRSIMEKTSSFFGLRGFGDCMDDKGDKALFERALNLFSHGKYSVFDPAEMNDADKKLFERILDAFTRKYSFKLPLIKAPSKAPSRTGQA